MGQEKLLQQDLAYIVVGIFAALEVIKACITVVEWFFKKMGLEFKWMRKKEEEKNLLTQMSDRVKVLEEQRKQDVWQSQQFGETMQGEITKITTILDEMGDSIESINTKLNKIQQGLDNAQAGVRETLVDKINYRFKTYVNLGGIPVDEIDEFNRMYETYAANGGNSTGKTKYDYCVKHLPIIPSQTVINEEYTAEIKADNLEEH